MLGNGITNIIHGVNQNDFDPKDHTIFSTAFFTTNAITPILKIVEDSLGIKKGNIETKRAFTNNQNLVDNIHPKYRRGRATILNMVITKTSAGKAVTKAIPSLKNKFTSNDI